MSDRDLPGRLVEDTNTLSSGAATGERWSPQWLNPPSRELLARTAGSLAHEIKNPLCSMKLMVSLMEEGLATGQLTKDPQLPNYVKHITRGIDAIERVISRVLDMTRCESLERIPLNLGAILQEEAALIAPRFKGDPPTVVIKGNPFIIADRDGMHRVVSSCLVNSAEATDYSGRVILCCDGTSDDRVVISIKDDGPGIPHSIRHVVCEPFFTTKARGTGIGLAVVVETVRLHSGSIEIEADNGTNIIISLPRMGGLRET